MAFQIADDLLDLVGKEHTVGKPLRKDICEGKLTLPLIHAMRVADQRDREWMKNIFKSGLIDGDVLERIRELVERYKGIEYSLEKAREYGEICKREIGALRRSECWNALALLPDYVIARAY
jgi:octaprenyl-diphosphate synthase